jgi:hypothetical protein
MDNSNTILLGVFGWLGVCGFLLILSWVTTVFNSFKLQNYLKNNHYDKWRELTSVGKIGPGLVNPFKGLAFLSKEMEGDEQLLRLQDRTKISVRYSVICGITFIISLVGGFIILSMAS